MIEWLTIFGLIAIGIFLVIAEVLFIPGIFIAGSLGILFSAYGVYLGYDYFGDTVGTIVLIGAIVGNILAFVLAFRGKTWQRFSLRESHTSKVNEDDQPNLQVGDRGKTISTLKPVGKALFNEKMIEVRSKGNYIDENVEIEIERIESSRILVKPIKE